ncbi:hypothetical protein ACOSQ3_006981 [Xanthoceras sorbifolium]
MDFSKRKKLNQAFFLPVIIILLILLNPSSPSKPDQEVKNVSLSCAAEVHVGVIVDMGSWSGKISHSCISMAISDICALDSHYKTRVVLHWRDSKGDPVLALHAALNLMLNVTLQAIIIAETSSGAEIFAELGSRAKIPIVSLFASGPSLTLSNYSNSNQIAHDEASDQAKGIATLIKAFKWKEAVLIYEDNNSGRDFFAHMFDSSHDANIYIAHRISIPPSSSDEPIIEKLSMIKTLKTKVFVVHMSHSLASRFFSKVKKLEMMSGGYVWIVTDTIMSFFHSMDTLAIESMQGVLGFKPYIPPSKELHNLTLRWRRKMYIDHPNAEVLELDVYAILAYDTVWAVAEATQKLNSSEISHSGLMFYEEIVKSRFVGLSGYYQLINGKLISRGFEIVNVIGKGVRRIGFWTSETGNIRKELNNSPSTIDLEGIIWPGGSSTIPKRLLTQTSSKKLRIGVPVNSGFRELVNMVYDPVSNATIVSGFCIDLFKAAMSMLTYEVDYEFIPYLSGSYNDLVMQVYLQKFDAVVGDITITANRSLYVDFTLPFSDMGIGMVMPIYQNNNLWIFLKPLQADLWLTSAAFFVFTGFVIWMIEHPINNEFQGSPAHQVGMVFWYSFSTLVFAHREKLLSNWSKFIVIIWVFVVLILSSSYTATLTSMLTVQQIQLGSKDYIGFHSVLPLATNNINFEDSRLKIYNSPKEYADALSKGSKNGGVSAIIDEIPYIKIFLAQYPADHYTMVVPNNSSTTNGFGYAFSKGSPLVSNISRAIASLREEKKLKMMEDYWFSYFSSQPPTFMSQDPSSNPSRLSLKRFGGLFLITGTSSALVLFIFFICSVYRKRHALRGIFMEKLEDLKDYIHNLHTCLRIYCEKIQC